MYSSSEGFLRLLGLLFAAFALLFLGVDALAGLVLAPPRLPTVPETLKLPEPLLPAIARIRTMRSWIARGVGASSVPAW